MNKQTTNIASFTDQSDGAGGREHFSLTGLNRGKNTSDAERIVSAIGGGALAVYGLTRGGWRGFATAAVGGMFLYRGLSGHCELYQMLGMNNRDEDSSHVSVHGGTGFKVEKTIRINKTPAELYGYWRDFENLPRFMDHLQSVTESGPGRSRWVAKAPAGTTVEWEAEVINDHPNELIAWRSLDGADVANAGSVHFTAEGSGTQVRVVLKYNPPAGRLGAMVAKLFGEDPERQIEEDLRKFKQLMETGAKVQGQGGL